MLVNVLWAQIQNKYTHHTSVIAAILKHNKHCCRGFNVFTNPLLYSLLCFHTSRTQTNNCTTTTIVYDNYMWVCFEVWQSSRLLLAYLEHSFTQNLSFLSWLENKYSSTQTLFSFASSLSLPDTHWHFDGSAVSGGGALSPRYSSP